MTNKPKRGTINRLLFPYWCVLYYGALLLFAMGLWTLNILGAFFITQKATHNTNLLFQSMIRALAGLYINAMRLFNGLILNFPNRHLLSKSSPSILIANHPSMIDAPIILANTEHVVCVFKAALKKNLLLPNTARLCGYVSNDQGIDTIRHAATAIRNGSHLLLFPEGTRTESSILDRLNASTFLIARRAKAPVRLLTIHTSSNLLIKGRHFLRLPDLPASFILRVGPAIEFSDTQPITGITKAVETFYHHIFSHPDPADQMDTYWPPAISFFFGPSLFKATLNFDSPDHEDSANTPHAAPINISALVIEWFKGFGFVSPDKTTPALNPDISNIQHGKGILEFSFVFQNSNSCIFTLTSGQDHQYFHGPLFRN